MQLTVYVHLTFRDVTWNEKRKLQIENVFIGYSSFRLQIDYLKSSKILFSLFFSLFPPISKTFDDNPTSASTSFAYCSLGTIDPILKQKTCFNQNMQVLALAYSGDIEYAVFLFKFDSTNFFGNRIWWIVWSKHRFRVIVLSQKKTLQLKRNMVSLFRYEGFM